MNFWQLLRRYADESREQSKRLVLKTVPVTHASISSHPEGPLSLKLVAVKAHGKENHALLDTIAVPNLVSCEFANTGTRPNSHC